MTVIARLHFRRRRTSTLVVLLLAATAIAFAGCKSSAVIAPAGDFFYYAGGASLAINKVATSDLGPPTSFTLPGELQVPTVGLLSPDGSQGYIVSTLGTATVITTVRTSDMQEITNSTLNAGSITSGVISPNGAFGYFGTETGNVTVVNLTTLEQVASVSTGSDALVIHTATISPDGDYAYFGTSDQRVVKVDLDTLTVAATATLADYGTYIANAVISPDGQYGYYTVGATPARFVKVRLSDMTPVGSITTSVNVADSTIISPDGQYAYIGTDDTPMRFITIRLADLVEVRAQTLTVSGSEGWAVMSPDGEYAYVGSGAGEMQKTRLVHSVDLGVTKAGTGNGTVTSATGEIDCGVICGHSYLSYQSVTLTATPTNSSTFAGWTGACSGTGTCTLAMSEARAVTATFSRPSNSFTTKTPKFSTTNSTITISTTLTVPGEGRLKQSVSGVARKKATLCSTTKVVKRAGTYTLTCLLGAKSRTALSAGALRLTVATTFAPTGGTARSTSRTVVVPRTPLKTAKPAAPVTG